MSEALARKSDEISIEKSSGLSKQQAGASLKRCGDELDDKESEYSSKSVKILSTGSSGPTDQAAASSIQYKKSDIYLKVPFWKQLNQRRGLSHLRTRHLGCFSLAIRNNIKECFEDKRYERVYKYPFRNVEVEFDLKVGEREVERHDEQKTINPMLWWILRHKEESFQNDRFTFDILCWRGVLRMIMFSIYEKQSDWLLAVVKFKNAYFICEHVTERQIEDEKNMTPEHRSFCYFGHKFEEYVTTNKLKTETWDTSQQIAGVYQSTIGPYRLHYGGELDCILENELISTEQIELKVCAGKSLDDLPFQYNRKFAKWWIQCFLADIKKMVIGLRDNDGIVSRLCPLNIDEIERAARTWTRDSFFNFFVLFADFLRDNVTQEYSPERKDVTLFHFSPSDQKITVQKSSDPKYDVLPDWFINEFTKQ